MTTTLDIVTRALRKISVTPSGDDPEAEYAADALDTLNAMMHGWKARNADTEHTTLELADTFPLDAEYEEPVMILLAERLASDFPGSTAPSARHVKDSWDIIKAAFMTLTGLSVDSGLNNMPSQIGRANQRTYFG